MHNTTHVCEAQGRVSQGHRRIVHLKAISYEPTMNLLGLVGYGKPSKKMATDQMDKVEF